MWRLRAASGLASRRGARARARRMVSTASVGCHGRPAAWCVAGVAQADLCRISIMKFDQSESVPKIAHRARILTISRCSGSEFDGGADFRCPDTIRWMASGCRKLALRPKSEPEQRNIVRIQALIGLFRTKGAGLGRPRTTQIGFFTNNRALGTNSRPKPSSESQFRGSFPSCPPSELRAAPRQPRDPPPESAPSRADPKIVLRRLHGRLRGAHGWLRRAHGRLRPPPSS